MPKFAICYFGLTRSIRYAYKSHYDNLFNVIKENGSEYDVYLHTWKTEYNNTIWNEKNLIPIDYTEYEFFNPVGYQLDDEDEYIKTIKLEKYYYGQCDEWQPTMIQNTICSLESKKRCFEMCLKSNIKYDYVIFIRPDLLLLDKFPYKTIFENNEFQQNMITALDEYQFIGYTNMFVITSFDYAHFYGNQVNEMQEYRKNIGRIITEFYTKYIMEKYYKVKMIHFPMRIIRPNAL